MFRRRRKDDSADEVTDSASEATEEEPTDDAAAVTGDASPQLDAADSAAVAAGAGQAGGGPYDVDEAPEDEIPRIDLGALRVPLIEGLEVRLDMDEQTGEPTQLVLADGDSMLQLGVFAAPRSSGIWPEIRQEIAESLTAAGGTCKEAEGPVGTELNATVPTGEPGSLAPARFIGVDRPRWFLRGLLSGPAAIDAEAAGRLEFALRSTIVVRGKDAMPIRDPLPLRLPPEAVQMAQDQLEAGGQEQGPTLEQLDPGPTITETR